jgi:hypothetical protein
MKVIAHQAPGVDLPVGFAAGFVQSLEEQLVVLIGTEDWLPMVAPVHEVVNRPRILNPDFPCHELTVQNRGDAVNPEIARY